jgi:hypothetical protein
LKLGLALQKAKATMVVLSTDVNDINARLDDFASQWAQASLHFSRNSQIGLTIGDLIFSTTTILH